MSITRPASRSSIITMTPITRHCLQGYRDLLQSLKEIQQFFETNEANRKERVNQSRLMLRQEIDRSEKSQLLIVDKLSSVESVSEAVMSADSDSEYQTESSSEHYNGSEVLPKPSIGRAERLAQRQKRRYSDRDSMPAKRPRLEQAAPQAIPTPPQQLQPQPPQLQQQLPPQQIKKKVYRICDDYFTEDLEPVQINEDGTLLHLAHNLISSDRYELARKMIAVYKHKTGTLVSPSPQNGTRPMVSSS